MRSIFSIWNLVGSVLFFVAFAGCTEVIDIELGSTYQRLVVYGTVTEDSVRHQVELSLTGDYFSNVPSPRVSGALVELESEGEVTELVEQDSLPGVYLVPEAFRGTPGTHYELRISKVDANGDGEEEIYTSESTMPTGAQLDSIRINYFRSPFFSGYQVFMYAFDPPERNWYCFKLWKNGELLTDTLSKLSIQTDDFFNGTYIYGLPVGFLADDDPRGAAVPGDTITFELDAIDESYYEFIYDAQLEIAGNNPLFSGPPANISSNIGNGGQGVFAAYSLQRVSLIIPEEEP